MFKEGDILIINDLEYLVERRVNKPYSLTKLRRLVDDSIEVIPTHHLIKKLTEER